MLLKGQLVDVPGNLRSIMTSKYDQNDLVLWPLILPLPLELAKTPFCIGDYKMIDQYMDFCLGLDELTINVSSLAQYMSPVLRLKKTHSKACLG